jgi:cobalamin biosynthesis protein CobC
VNAVPKSFDVFRLHGGKVETARSLFPNAHLPWIDLSTGISPWSYPHDRIADNAFTRLPDPEAITHLEVAAAGSFGVADASRVIATPGSDIALRVIGRILSGTRVAVVRPGYSGHVLMWDGAPVTAIGATDLRAAAIDHDVIVLANPNNPDGRVVGLETLLAVAEQLGRRSGTLIVDEAFADVQPEHSVCPVLGDERTRGVIVLRSFGKFYGLAGVRLGFVVADGSERWRAFGDWPVSGPAVAIGVAAYRDYAWQSLQRRRLTEAAQRLDALLLQAGLSIAGGTVLYRLARCPDADAVFRHLASHGVLTRPFSSDPTLLRIGLPADESQWQRLGVALNSRCSHD